ncbi:hypothetical protein PMAYCL1PPCAC_03964, partial [Pristionchus mayeri]
SAAALSRADYLKKYTTGGGSNDVPKKKKKSKKSHGPGISIVEEDAFKKVNYGAKPDMGSDMEDEIQFEAEVKNKIDTAKAKFRPVFADEPVVKKEPLSRSPSPVARRKRRDSDASPRRKDASPPRRTRRDSDASPPRRTRRDSDNSPPRKASPRRKRRDSDASPPRRTRRDSDNSPPRATRRRRDSDASPPRRRERDSSPPRRNRRDSDASPPRKRKHSDSSPPRRRERDSSPPRRKREASPSIVDRRAASPKRIKEEPVDEDDGQARTLDGKKAGLQSAADLREEGLMMKNREIQMFTKLAATISGRGAETVVRQKMTGKKNNETQEDKEKKEREAAKQSELDAKYKAGWNKGVAQQERRAAALEEAARVAAEPWARMKDDEAMNDHLKEDINVKDDPLADFILKKRQKINIQKGRKVYPQYEGAWPPNRFGIAPGCRWDGVVRGNGFEGQLAISANSKRAAEQEYYQNIQLYE